MTQSYHARLAATALRPISWGAARPCGSERALGNIIDGPWQVGAIAGRPAHDHWTTRPSSGSIEPTIACDDCTFVERLQGRSACDAAGLFFRRSDRGARERRCLATSTAKVCAMMRPRGRGIHLIPRGARTAAAAKLICAAPAGMGCSIASLPSSKAVL